VVEDFPVLSAGPTPQTPLDEWSFTIKGAVDTERTWSWEEFLALPSETFTVDIHCVTKWAKLGTTWTGVSVDELLMLTKAVVRGASRALVVADLPFGSYQASPTQALETAVRFFKEGGAAAVKLEGGAQYAGQIRALSDAGIPVMAHRGFTPQSEHALGGFRVQGRGAGAEKLIEDALAVQAAGAFAVVLGMVPADVAKGGTPELGEATLGNGGTLISYLGDGFMAVFGAPLEQEDHADRALSAAREILADRLPRFNEWLREQGHGEAFRVGIGINTGPFMAGNVGSDTITGAQAI